ncbi:hypothetical protein PV04_00185 [Phialophora macrospora]|uniref:Ubiquitin-like domain-containing protein n=1 Tax=Phialophora macrospora TaxID=1851006 RepID=A0A0D2GI21_9EURO|nr:hypothetical protein PV04_00185 [Phialophora macrospora]
MASGVKRSLFTKPAWAASNDTKSDRGREDGSIFGRNVAYDEIVRAQKAERERKAAKAKARNERQRSKEESEGPESKRRRISTELDDDSDSNKQMNKSRDRPVTRSTPMDERPLADELDASLETSHSRRPKSRKAAVINLDGDGDDEDDELTMLTPPKPRDATLKNNKKKEKEKKKDPDSKDRLDDENMSSEEDEYLHQLKQKAREKARRQRERDRDQGNHLVDDIGPRTPSSRGGSAAIEDKNRRSSSVAQDHSRPTSATPTSTAPFNTSNQAHAPAPASVQEEDPEVKILISSEIPNTKPLIVKRRASQSLKQVKEFWCRKFELDETVARQVFFTWNGTRLFDSTTMRGILRGLKKDAWQKGKNRYGTSADGQDEQNARGDGDEFDEKSAKDPSNGKIMLEAMTQDMYDRQQQRQREGTADSSQQDQYQNLQGRAEEQAPSQSDGAIIIRLVSNNKDLEPMQLRVRPHTTIGKIMRGYAATRNVDEGKTPWLIFDGDRLEPEMTVEEVGFEDEEQVEVSIR